MLRFQRCFSLNLIIRRCLSRTKFTLLETLSVIQHSPDVFIQPAETLFIYPYRTSVFGGQIIGSAVYAAQKTLTKNYPLHSLHSYFLTAADNSSEISYTVKRLRDGKSFETRSVTARQENKIIFEGEMSFHRNEEGNLSHQAMMPTAGKLLLGISLAILDDLFSRCRSSRRIAIDQRTIS